MALRALVVDDDPNVLQVLEHSLVFDGYEVSKAVDGLEALQVARSDRPDVILLDVMMPGLNGLEVVEELRKDVELQHIPVIVLTARTSDVAVWEGWRSGVDSYLTKPLDIFALLAEIERVTRGGNIHLEAVPA
jgi:two-component system alkaline phosphatase synthesis response regulator PhoP